MSICSTCSEFGRCLTATQMKGQAEYLDRPEYQNPEWVNDFAAFLARIESSECTNPQVRQKLKTDKQKLNRVRTTVYQRQAQSA